MSEEKQWYEWGSEYPVTIDIRKLDDEIITLILLQATGSAGYENYFDELEHGNIIALAWRRGLLGLDRGSIGQTLGDLEVVIGRTKPLVN